LGFIENDSKGAELLETLSNDVFTVFAPNDEAFLDLQGLNISDTDVIENVLLYHAVPDNKVFAKDLECDSILQMANGGKTLTQCEGDNFYQVGDLNDGQLPQIVESDLSTCTGLVHVVDKILLPPSCKSIYLMACSTPDLSLFCDLISIAELEETFRGEDILTVFAPTNKAIENFRESISNQRDYKFIKNAILYHTVTGSLTEPKKGVDCNATSTTPLDMANSGIVEVACIDDNISIVGGGNSNDTLPQLTNVTMRACNGIIHVIDEVILPADKDCQTFGTNERNLVFERQISILR